MWHSRTYVLPYLMGQEIDEWYQETIRVVGIGESQIETHVKALSLCDSLEIGFAMPPRNHV